MLPRVFLSTVTAFKHEPCSHACVWGYTLRWKVHYVRTRQCCRVDRRMLEHGLAGCTSAMTSAELVFQGYVSLVLVDLSCPLPEPSSRGGSRGESTKSSNAVIPLIVAVSVISTAQHSLVVGARSFTCSSLLEVVFLASCSMRDVDLKG